MSSDPPSDALSAAADPDLAATLRIRGEPLLEALERHNPGSREHADSTATYAFAAAAELGQGRDRCEVAREAVRLHEVGQVYVDPEVLRKPAAGRGRRERKAFARHYEDGHRLARGSGIPEEACRWLLRMRESFDGTGPEELAGEAIPLESRLMRATCELHTELQAAAAEGSAAPYERAAERLGAEAGSALDPRVVEALVAILRRAAA